MLHIIMVFIPSSCGVFVCKHVTSIETRIVSSGNFFSPKKLIKSVLSWRYHL